MKPLRIHTFMHVPYEGLGCIAQWVNLHNHTLSFTCFYEQFSLPSIDEVDWLIVMGGPMSVYEENRYSWLKEEKTFINKMIQSGKTVIGICLGSQLIAEVLGAKVYPNRKKEIGWYDVKTVTSTSKHPILESIESQFTVFHWHGDTYDMPQAAQHLFYTDICTNQAFIVENRVLGLQFHFEVTSDTLKDMVENGISELLPSKTIQSADEILSTTKFINSNNRKMFQLLDYLVEK